MSEKLQIQKSHKIEQKIIFKKNKDRFQDPFHLYKKAVSVSPYLDVWIVFYYKTNIDVIYPYLANYRSISVIRINIIIAFVSALTKNEVSQENNIKFQN